MKVTVIAKNIELTNALREMVEKKISKLGKYFNSDIEAKATLSVQRNRQIVEIMIPFNGVVLRGEEANEDMYKAIDLVEEKLERQIRKQKTKLSRKKNGSLKFGEIVDLSPVAADEEEAKLVKRKKFGVKPMDIDEAILQMELVGHSFFVYQDVESNKINVVYRRKDGDYGLLDPEYR